jgi:ubiquitin-like protein ATG12
VTIRLHPIGSAPALKKRIFRLSTNQRFETIVRFLRKKLGVREHESVFCYVGNVFSPALDEGVGNLWSVSIFFFSLYLGSGEQGEEKGSEDM